MKPPRVGFALLAGLLAVPNLAGASGVVTNTSLTSLLAAMTGGGTVYFAATGTVIVSSTIIVSTDTWLIDTNHSVVISGAGRGSPVQVFKVNPGVQFTLDGLTVADGSSTNGGAIYNSGTLLLTGCTFSNNIASGSSGAVGIHGSFGTIRGTDAGPGGPGMPASGGALYNAGTATVNQCTFVTNQVLGGTGGAGGNGGPSNFQDGAGGTGGDGATGFGGAIYSAGILQVSNTWFILNTARGGNGGAGGTNGAFGVPGSSGDGGAGNWAAGGAVYAAGPSSLSASTFSGNSSISGNAAGGASFSSHFIGGTGRVGPDGFGGGLFNAGTNIMVNCTFYTNTVSGGNGGQGGYASPYPGNGGAGGNAWGGNLYNRATIYVTNCTLASGAAHPGVGGGMGSGGVLARDGSPGSSLGDNVANNGSVAILKNTLLASPLTSANVYGAITDGMNNLSSDNTPLSFPIARRNTNPMLLPLSNNGGPTPTMAIANNSPAVDAGDCTGSPSADQRGYPRDGRCDIGAFEFQAGITPSPPLLNLTPDGHQLSLSWSASAIGYTLSSATNLIPPIVWQPITNDVHSNLSILNVTVPMTNRSAFFHLLPD